MLRWGRASVVALVVLAAGGIAHASAGGLLPGATTMVPLYALVVAGCAALLGREASTLRLVAILVAGQAFVHSALAATAGHRGDSALVPSASPVVRTPVLPWNPRTGESYDQWAARAYGDGQAPGLTVPAWVTHAVSDLTAHPTMALSHVLAAVAVGAWLAVGERALWSLMRLVGSQVTRLVSTAAALLGGLAVVLTDALRPQPRPSSFRQRPLLLPVWSRGPVRRGPPVLVVPAR